MSNNAERGDRPASVTSEPRYSSTGEQGHQVRNSGRPAGPSGRHPLSIGHRDLIENHDVTQAHEPTVVYRHNKESSKIDDILLVLVGVKIQSTLLH